MSRFEKYIVERKGQMTFDLALKTFGVTAEEVSDKALLKKKYRSLAIKNHPDKPTGSHEKMQDINDAYDLLTKSKVKINKKFDWEASNLKYKIAGARIKTELLSNFQADVFIRYLQELSGLKFNYEIVKVYPTEKDRSPSFAGFDVEFFTNDKSSVFTFKVSAYLPDVMYPKAELGYADLSYNVVTTAHGFHLNKKQKMSQRDWKFTRDHSFFRKPEMIYPKKKMKDIFSGKTSNRKFMPRDMVAFLSKKLNAKIEYPGKQTQAAIPLGEDYTLILWRTTWNRVGAWNVDAIYLKKGKYGYGSKVSNYISATFMEEEATARIFEKVQKDTMKVKGDAKIKKAESLIKLAYEAYKKMKGIG
jgi:hypothetical protein